GGISLKPALKMYDMKGDMAGGAAVIAGTAAAAELQAPVRILTVVAAAENLVSGESFRPGDILRAANGKTIEITNTDAEGRLVGAHRHGRPRLPRALARRLLHAARRHRLRRPPHRRAHPTPRRLNFDLGQEHELVRSTVREFAQERVAPVAEELDREGRFPYELVGELAELGLMGMTIPEEYGGAGTDTLSYAIAIEELTRADSSVAITVAAHHSLGTLPIYYFGSDEQRR